MVGVLLKKEIREHLMTFRFGAALVTTFALVVISVWVLSDDYIRRQNAYNVVAERSARENLEVYVPSQISPVLHRPPSPLSIFAQGEDPRFGNAVRVHRWEVPREATGSVSDNMLLSSRPSFDLLSIFALVISLFGILLTYDQISGEREKGTMKLLASGLPKRGALFATKFFSAVICLAIPFLFSFIASLLILTFTFGIVFTSGQWLAIALMAVTGLLYGALFVAIGLACSVLVRRSATALVLSIFVWTLAVLLIPSAAQSIAGSVIPLPDPNEIVDLASASEQEVNTKLAEEFWPTHPDAGSGWCGGWDGGGYFMFDGLESNYSDTAELTKFWEPLMFDRARKVWALAREHESVKFRQAALADSVASIAPVHHLRRAFTALAGTNVQTQEEFLEMARHYRQGLISDFQSKEYFGKNAMRFFTRRPESEIRDDLARERFRRYQELRARGERDFAGPFQWGPLPRGSVPPFSFESGEPQFAAALWPMLFLFAATVIVFAIGFVTILRYDVR